MWHGWCRAYSSFVGRLTAEADIMRGVITHDRIEDQWGHAEAEN